MPRERIATWPSRRANRLSIRPNEVMTDNKVVTLEEIESFNVLYLDPNNGAGRNVTLPPEAACVGVYLWIVNTADAAEVLTILDALGGAIGPGCTPTMNEVAMLFCDGVQWRGTVGTMA